MSSPTPDVNPRNLKDLLVAVERISKGTPDAEGVQKELQNQGFGEITLPDVQALLHTVQDKKAPKPPVPAPVTPATPVVTSTSPTPQVTPIEPASRTTESLVIPAEVVAAPVAEIDNLIASGYGPTAIEKIMKANHHNAHRDVVRQRFKASRAGVLPASSASTSPTAVGSPVVGNAPVSAAVPTSSSSQVAEDFDAVEALKFMQSLNLPSGGSMSQSPATRPFPDRFREWRQAVEAMTKMKMPIDASSGSLLAENMGSPDIAAVVRSQGLQAAISASGAFGLGGATMIPSQIGGQPAAAVDDFDPSIEINKMMRTIMKYRMMMPLMNMMMSGMGSGTPDGQTNPQVAEVMKRLEKQDQEKALESVKQSFRDEITRLQQNKPDPAAQAQIETLKMQLGQMEKNQEKAQQTSMFKDMASIAEKTGTNAKDLYSEISKSQAEAAKTLELERIRHQTVEAENQRHEREMYTQRLQSLEAKLEAQMQNQNQSPMEVYTAFRTVVKDEVADLQKAVGAGDKGTNIPEILSTTLREFAPAVTAFAQSRSGAAARPVGPTPATHAAQTVGAAAPSKLQGTCQWCSQVIVIDDVDGAVPCPSCGKALYPRGEPATVQAPAGPEAPPMPQPLAQPPVSTAIPPTIEYVGTDGQLHQRRNPTAAIIT